MIRWVALISALGVASCASSSGVFESSPGVYKISSTAITSFGGAATAKGDAYKKATATCAAQGKKVEMIAQESDAQFTGASVDMTFRCV